MNYKKALEEIVRICNASNEFNAAGKVADMYKIAMLALQNEHSNRLENATPGSVMQPWVCTLTFMQQSVLMAGVRGPDGIHKNHISKVLLRWYRRCVFYSAFEKKIFTDPFTPGGGSFTGPCTYTHIEYVVKQYLLSLDEIPHHFQLHFMHGAEIIGYKHPDARIRGFWQTLYFKLVNDMHLVPETIEEMDFRLGDNERQWKSKEEVTANNLPINHEDEDGDGQ